MSKTVEISKKEFDKLVERLDYFKGRCDDLEETVKFLNDQIHRYNIQFAEGHKNGEK